MEEKYQDEINWSIVLKVFFLTLKRLMLPNKKPKFGEIRQSLKLDISLLNERPFPFD